MKRTTITPVGALHPILFFAVVYVVTLFFSIFICSTIFYSCNTSANASVAKEKKTKSIEIPGSTVASLK